MSTDETSMVVSEPAMANCTTSYTDAMMMIHTMHLSREDKERGGGEGYFRYFSLLDLSI